MKGGVDLNKVGKGAGYFLMILIGLAIFLFILAVIFFIVQKRSQKSGTQLAIKYKMPPEDYMKYVGVNCPDYWEYMGEDPSNKGNHICKNTMNLEVNDKNFCYSNQDEKLKSFSNIDWDNVIKNGYLQGDAVKQICDWKKKCGPSANQDASWLGVNTDNGWVKC